MSKARVARVAANTIAASDPADLSPELRAQQRQLATIAELADELERADGYVERLEERLARAKEYQRRIAEEMLPEAVEVLGLATVKTSTGLTVTVKRDVRASVSAKHPERRLLAFAWLDANGEGELIRREVVAKIGRDRASAAMADKIRAYLENEGVSFADQLDVHNGQLCAFLRRKLEEGADIPLEVFGADLYTVAKVTRE